MKNILFLLFAGLSLNLHAQFVEVSNVIIPNGNGAAVMGKDANGLLYGSAPGGIYRKIDRQDAPWEQIGSPGGQLAVCEVSGYKMFNHFFQDVYSSNDGQNWSQATFPGGSTNVSFIKYLDNNALIIAKTDKTLISTNGGSSYEDFFNEEIISIAWDNFNSRYVFSTTAQLYYKTSTTNAAVTLYGSAIHGLATIPYYGYFMCVDNKGIIYTTEKSAFPWIKKYDPTTENLEQIYPAGSSYPIHPRGLFSTGTGRTYCVSWANAGTFLISDDPENNYISSIPQGGYDSHFLDKAGNLYLVRGIAYAKSDYSVRQPVFFEQMNDLMDEGFNNEGFNLRASNNALLSLDYEGNVYSSFNDGTTWDSISKIPNFSNSNPLKNIFQHPSGKIFAGRSGPIVMESSDDGLTWLSSPVTTSVANGTFVEAAYKQDGNYTFFIKEDQMLRSNDDGATLELMASTDIFLPNFGIYKGYSCLEVTDSGTVLVGGIINTGYVYRSTNNLDSITPIAPLGAPQQAINDIYQDATGKIWMGTYLGLLHSTDDGLTWTKDINYPELSALEIIENIDGSVIVAGNNNTYILEDGLWKRISYGYNNNFINLFLDPVTTLLFAQGNYKTITSSPELYTPIFSRETRTTKNLTLNFYPNPSTDFVKIENRTNESGRVIIMNSLGQEVMSTSFNKESDEIILSTIALARGTYFLVKKTNDGIASKHLMLK